jgi:hypothetical protein
VSKMNLASFRHNGLRRLYEDDSAQEVAGADGG